jgi:hypothetical protein
MVTELPSRHGVGVRPLLLLDVDGVPSPFGGSVPPSGFERTVVDGFQPGPAARPVGCVTSPRTSNLVWATTWEHKANRAVSPRLGLPQLPVIEFTSPRTGDTWKLTDVARHVGDRAVAWVDDELNADAHRWAHERHASTLLIRPSHLSGWSRPTSLSWKPSAAP